MRVISVVGVKQGVGATTAAIQVAQALQKKGERVCLVDADPAQDVGFFLELGATLRSASQLLSHRDRLSGDQVLGYLHQVRHQLGVLTLDTVFQDVCPMLSAYDTIVVDGLIADADSILLLTSPEAVMLRAIAPSLQRLRESLVPTDRVALVANAWRSHDLQVRSVLSAQYRHFPLHWVVSDWESVVDGLARPQLHDESDMPLANRLLLKQRLLQEFQEKFDLKSVAPSLLREEADRFVRRLIADTPSTDRSGIDCAELIQEVLNEALGLGLLESLMSDPAITEVMVNGRRRIFVERAGKLAEHDVHFETDAQIEQIIERIVTPIGRRVDESSPMVDARLPDGSRVNIVVPPLALDGPTITIRRFSPKRWRLTDLVAMGSMSEEMIALLRAAIQRRLNIIVSGGTGSGKTTLLNVLSDEVGETERIVTIEDAAELQLRQPHVVRLESRPPNLEGRGAVTIRDLVKNALRMRPNRIIVGECRGGEALDMLQAMNTGHDGSLTTIHANSPRAALSRLETLVLFSGMELPIRAIRDQISSAIDLIVQVSRLHDGARKIVQVSEIVGQQGDVITLQDLVTYRDGHFVMGSFRPKFMEATT